MESTFTNEKLMTFLTEKYAHLNDDNAKATEMYNKIINAVKK